MLDVANLRIIRSIGLYFVLHPTTLVLAVIIFDGLDELLRKFLDSINALEACSSHIELSYAWRREDTSRVLRCLEETTLTQRWEIGNPDAIGSAPILRAVAYYRQSAQDRKENSILIQRDQVRGWTGENGVEFIHEFADAGKSGLNAEGRPAFTEVMEEWVEKRSDFQER